MVKTFTQDNFNAEVLSSDKPVLVDFWAQWCGPCKMIAPLLDKLAEAVGETAVVGKVDIDANPQLANQYNVRSIPFLLFFKNGEVQDSITGAGVSLESLKEKLEGLAS